MFPNGRNERDTEVEIPASCRLAWELLGDLVGWPLAAALDTPT
jgi:hypothetical protein